MIRDQFILKLQERIKWDNFAGGGGACTGIEAGSGCYVEVSVNHDGEACAMRRANHPQAETFMEDVWGVDIKRVLRGRSIGFAWFSPDCKDHSKAKGSKPLSAQIRGLAWLMEKFAGQALPDVMVMENVEEIEFWGNLIARRCKITGRVLKIDGTVAAPGERVPVELQSLMRDPKRLGRHFRRLVAKLRAYGYVVEWRLLRACDYGAPTIRRRLFMICRRDGKPIVWPKATHGDPESPEVKSGKLKPWRIAAECIDFSIPCPSVLLTKEEAKVLGKKLGRKIQRPLVPASNRRVAAGTERYTMKAAKPFILSLTHHGGNRVEDIEDPFNTITAARRGEKAFVSHHIAYQQQGGGSRPADAPIHTICASSKDQNQVVAVHIARQFSTTIGHAADEPAQSVMAGGGGGKSQVISAFLAQHNTGVIGHAALEPFSSITSSGSHQQLVSVSLVKYYGTEQDPKITEPLHSVTTKDRFGLVMAELGIPPLTPELAVKARKIAQYLRDNGVEVPGEFAYVGDPAWGIVIYDIGMRMFEPHELFAAQGFPKDYIITHGYDEHGNLVKLSKTAQIRMCGNSVSPPVAAAITAANLPEDMFIRYGDEKRELVAA